MAFAALLLCCTGTPVAQTTAFTYQGKLTDGGNPASGSYDMQFTLYDSPTVGTGTQYGFQNLLSGVAASAGIFTVTLDVGNVFWTGVPLYLEIGVKPAGSPNAYTLLSPRHALTNAPYAIQSLKAFELNEMAGVSTFTVDNALGGVNPSIGFNSFGSGRTAGAQGYGGLFEFNNSTGDLTYYIGSNVSAGGSHTLTPRLALTADSRVRMGNFSGSAPSATLYLKSPATGADEVGIWADGFFTGVVGKGDWNGVEGSGNTGSGVVGSSTQDSGVLGYANVAADTVAGVRGVNTSASGGYGVLGESVNGLGGIGVKGKGTTVGVYGDSTSGLGVYGSSGAVSQNNGGVVGYASSSGGIAVIGNSNLGNGTGVFGKSTSGAGYGVYASNLVATTGWSLVAEGTRSGLFAGAVQVNGTLSKGGGSFKIDHPLDPERKYLYHSFVESPDMMNIYNGNVTTDASGLAVVELPEWFEALNRDFRYQLTVIGTFAQAIVAKKVNGNRFTIATNVPDVEVSWQVTGIRKDAYANANRIPVDEAKPAEEQGTYLHPAAFGKPETAGMWYRAQPEVMRSAVDRSGGR